MIQKQAIINDNMRQKQTVVQEDNMEQEQYSASVKVEDTEEDRMMDAAQENSLMLVRGMVDDDMEHIADMKEQFSQTIDPILRMYNAAMCATTACLEIIEDEFKYRKLRCPIHHIDTRLKSAKSILGKLQKKDLDLTLSAACNNIYDIAGVRVVCSYIKDVYLIRDRLMAQDDHTYHGDQRLYRAAEGQRLPQSAHHYPCAGLFYEQKTDGTRRAADPYPCNGSLGELGARHQVQVALSGCHDGFFG